MQLIEGGFGGWWRKYSAQALVAIAAVSAAWAASTDLQAIMTAKQLAAANGVLAVLGFIGRFIRQTKEQ